MKQQNIVFIESTDNYPYKFTANNSKVRLIIDGLRDSGAHCHIINRIYGSKLSKIESVKKEVVDEVEVWSLPRFSKSKLGFIRNIVSHFKIVKSLYRKGENNIIIMGGPMMPIYLFCTISYHLLGYNIGVMLTEWPKVFPVKNKLKEIDNFLFCSTFGYSVSMIFPISQFLEKQCEKFNKKMFKIPILANFHGNLSKKGCENYFLLCTTFSYESNIETTVNSFLDFVSNSNHNDYKLKLILSGDSKKLEIWKDKVSKIKKATIDIYSQIPYSLLMQLYQNANGLLIPLRDTIQDNARFSQKIAEYVSTGRPIITNAVGDIPLYFKNKENAYIAENYSEKEYSAIMNEIASNPEEADLIGYKGYITGKEYFDNINVCKKLSLFLDRFA